MANVKTIAEFFLLSLTWTLTLFSPIASSQLTGNGFIKLISNLGLGTLVITLIMSASSSPMPFLTLPLMLKLIAAIALVSITLFHPEEKNVLMWIMYALVVVSLGVHIAILSPEISTAFFLLSSALFLGIITYAMVLGHWYLVVPKLSERPLKIAALITWVILALKLVISLVSVYQHFDFFQEATTLGSGYAFNWLLLSMRISFGYVVILGMSLFNWKLVSMRSIQSSTGVLYAMTFFIFIGELISNYIFFNYGLLI